MNERIRELESQCWETRQVTSDAHSWQTYFNAGKFAELIVRECAGIADEPTSQPFDSYGKKIKQHFGVEE